jgi:GNAT superfamily N-acetyltransferase
MRHSVLHSSNEPDFVALLKIYQTSIDPSEQKSAEDLARALADRRYRFSVTSLPTAENQHAVVGFSIMYTPSQDDFWLLEYMAVAPGARSRGLGRAIFNAAASAARAEGRLYGVLEVDAVSGSFEQRQERRRRLAFYQSLGCRAIEALDYILPLETNGEPPPMKLLVAADAATTHIMRAQVERWVERIYVEVYRRTKADPRITAMAAKLQPVVALIDPLQGEVQ